MTDPSTRSLPTAPTSLPTPARALAIGAHPDDIEFGCGATLAKWAAAGCAINHLVLTDGSKGSWDPDEDVDELIVQREHEQLAAARSLGSRGKVVMLGHVDGELESTLPVRDQVAYWIRRLQPDVVLGHDPWKRYRLHPDHRHAGWLTIDGTVAARDPHFHRDHDVPHHRPQALLLFEADEPNHVEDVTGFGDTKVGALLEHRSQLRSTMKIEPGDDGTQLQAFRSRVLGRLAEHGAHAGVGEAEVFRLLDEV